MKSKNKCYVNYIFKLAALLLCLCLLAGCTAPSNVRDDFSADGFIEFLDNENFVPGVEQGDFIDQIGKYRYDELPLSLRFSFDGHFYDGANGGGYRCLGVDLGIENWFQIDEGQDVATYTNRFYTRVPLEGLQLPYGIDFTDNLDSVLSKLGILKSADELTEDVRLWQDGYREINWQKGTAKYETGTLLFTQEYGIAKSDGRPCKVVRSVSFSFIGKTNGLEKVGFSVEESYPYFQ